MSRGGFRGKSQFDRMIDDYGFGGSVKKDMSIFPRLEVAPLPFPKIDDYTDFRESYVCQMAVKMTTSFRESPNYHPRETDETPDVERYNEKVQLKSVLNFDYDRLPLELHPEYRKIRAAERKRKILEERKEAKRALLLENINTEGNAGDLTEQEKEELLGNGNEKTRVEEMDLKNETNTDDDEDGHVSDDNLDDDQGDYGDAHFDNGEEDTDI
ncbi:unnamed protein product [Oikopleura dioica]|uniref:DNA-directed RNA polymerase III subunit n=1 Tax=Oikopleura dioica TaxID=34765 RepID=E4YBY7_OIKDI|nr:unnamed protein product [Oikopleura dioica]